MNDYTEIMRVTLKEKKQILADRQHDKDMLEIKSDMPMYFAAVTDKFDNIIKYEMEETWYDYHTIALQLYYSEKEEEKEDWMEFEEEVCDFLMAKFPILDSIHFIVMVRRGW